MLDYFYTQPENIKDDELIIDGDEFNHMVHVMRKKIGDHITVVDGLGNAYLVELKNFEKKTATGKISEIYRNFNEPDIKVSLGVGILKNPAKFDFLVEKVTELGVFEIIPLITERTIPKHAKIDRWQKLALAAMKQCRRSYLPKVHPLITFDEVFAVPQNYDGMFLLHQNIDNKVNRLLKQTAEKQFKKVILLIGPEGGFSEIEVDKALQNRFTQASLGMRRLRTETAAIVSCSLLLAQADKN